MADRAQAQRAVEFQASLLEAVEQAVVATDSDGKILFWNRYAEVLYGWWSSEVTGRDVRDVVSFETDGRRVDYLGACSEEGTWGGSVDALGRPGSRFAAYAVCSELRCAGGGFVLVSLDVSDLRQAKNALRRSEARYSSLVENSPTGIVLVQDGCLTFANKTLATMLGYSVRELLGLRLAQLVHPEDQPQLDVLEDPREARARESEGFEYRFLDRSGELRWVLLHAVRVHVEEGTATLCNIQDVTDQKRMERDLRKLSNRLLVVQEEERARVARDLHDSIGQTLSAVKLVVESVSSRLQFPNERRSEVKRLHAMVPMTQHAIEELRQITYALRPPMLDSLGLISTMVWYLNGLKKVCPSLAIDHALLADESDIPEDVKVPIFRVLQEATSNAAKYSGSTRLAVGLECEADRLLFWVRDNGQGFDPTSVRRLDGRCGSGLSFMRERVTLSGGLFTLVSAPGRGTEIQAVWKCARELPALSPDSGSQDAVLDRVSG